MLSRGLSPLARGNPACKPRHPPARGPIPARTGQPYLVSVGTLTTGAYPRSHGATRLMRTAISPTCGLSPLARGNLSQKPFFRHRKGPIPARTGQPCGCHRPEPLPRAYPRSHGATQRGSCCRERGLGLSPLARGNLDAGDHEVTFKRPIPARTGQPTAQDIWCCGKRAYPRSHGATPTGQQPNAHPWGLSPLARGNLY